VQLGDYRRRDQCKNSLGKHDPLRGAVLETVRNGMCHRWPEISRSPGRDRAILPGALPQAGRHAASHGTALPPRTDAIGGAAAGNSAVGVIYDYAYPRPRPPPSDLRGWSRMCRPTALVGRRRIEIPYDLGIRGDKARGICVSGVCGAEPSLMERVAGRADADELQHKGSRLVYSRRPRNPREESWGTALAS